VTVDGLLGRLVDVVAVAGVAGLVAAEVEPEPGSVDAVACSPSLSTLGVGDVSGEARVDADESATVDVVSSTSTGAVVIADSSVARSELSSSDPQATVDHDMAATTNATWRKETRLIPTGYATTSSAVSTGTRRRAECGAFHPYRCRQFADA
jgi:hypothetical protein